MEAQVHLALTTCVQREPSLHACTPPGFEWIPDYLNQYGGQLSEYGRNWLLDKWEEPYRAALASAEQEYQDCLQSKSAQALADARRGLQLRVAAKLDARTVVGQGQPVGLAAQINVRFAPTQTTVPPCDPFAPPDPDHPNPPVDPKAQPVSVPLSLFWSGTSAAYDLGALKQAMQPVNSLLNQANPLSLRDLQLNAEGVKSAVRIGQPRFLPIPAQVQAYDDLQTTLEVTSIRLDFTAEWASNGAVLDAWSAVSTSAVNLAAYTDFYCYYLGCSWWASPPPVFDWTLVPPGCLEDLIFRAQPSAITLIRVMAEGRTLDTLTLSTGYAGTIESRPIVARHRLFNSPGVPQRVLPPIAVGPVALGVTQEVIVVLPACLVGKVELAADTAQDFKLFQQDGVIDVSVAMGTDPGTLKLRLTLQRSVYHWDRDVDIRFNAQGGVDIGYPPQGWWPSVVLRVPLSWNGCDAFHPKNRSYPSA